MVVVVDELSDLMMRAPGRNRALHHPPGPAFARHRHPSDHCHPASIHRCHHRPDQSQLPGPHCLCRDFQHDSRVILDQPGAEKLLGKGDMLFQAPDSPAPVRLQGCYVSDGEILRLVDHWRLQGMNINPTLPGSQTLQIDNYPSGVPLKQGAFWDEAAGKATNEDPIMKEAIELVRRAGKASISMLQRRLSIGYSRAARLIDSMEDQGIIAPAYPGAPSREVLDYGESAPPPEAE